MFEHRRKKLYVTTKIMLYVTTLYMTDNTFVYYEIVT